jgi:haloalkane dehalogenase
MAAGASGGSDWVDRLAWPWPERFVALPAGRLHHVDVGAGEVVLFVHGTPTWSFDWRHLIADLSRDHRCVAVDHLGFGRSDRPVGAGYRPEDHAERLAAFVEALDLRDYTLVVHDFGGPIALPLAFTAERRPKRIVLLNSWGWSFEDDPGMRRAAAFAGSWVGRWLYRWANFSLRVIAPSAFGDRRKLTPAIHRQWLAPFVDRQARVDVLWALAFSLLGSSAHYASIEAQFFALRDLPVLIVWGLADSAFPPRYLDRWRAALPGAAVVALEGVGHWPHEEAPERVIAAVRSFLG